MLEYFFYLCLFFFLLVFFAANITARMAATFIAATLPIVAIAFPHYTGLLSLHRASIVVYLLFGVLFYVFCSMYLLSHTCPTLLCSCTSCSLVSSTTVLFHSEKWHKKNHFT